jgi:hypothetical protein
MGSMKPHWSAYATGTGYAYRYRHCLLCGKVWRNKGERPLIRKGGKP